MKLNKLAAALCAAGLMGLMGTAQATLVNLDAWKIDFEALGDLSGGGGDDWTGFGVLGSPNTLDTMTFNALYKATGVFTGPGGLPAVGDKFNTDLAGAATAYTATGGGFVIQTSTGMTGNVDFELTFLATTTQRVQLVAGPFVGHGHLGVGAGPDGFTANGILEVYADVISGPGDLDGGLAANTSPLNGGEGMDDGVLIATFAITPSFLSGSFNAAAFDGQDDATWVLLTNNYNIITDADGNPLLPGYTIAFTDSNTDGDQDNNGIRDTNPNHGLFAGLCPSPQTLAVNCGVEDGSFNLAIPEPGSLALIGFALAGVGAMRRRRAAK